jgi:ATP-dependent helicase HepA
MPSFSLHQRYTSEQEPELGTGVVTETAKGRVKIHFPASGETRLYAAETAPLRRVRFSIGDTVVDREGRTLVVESVLDDDDLIVYRGQGRTVREADLGNMAVKHVPFDRLRMGEVDSPTLFVLRRRTLAHDHARRISPVHGFLGGRIDLIPHQLYIAQEVSGRYAPRVLLSDEVGLGKTIEACLILHRLHAQGRISRILILVPDSLVHQWFVELLRRFNMWFYIFDEARCASVAEGAPDGNPFLDSQLVLCSTSFLAESPLRALQARAAGWDMLVVDEAHHLAWSVQEASPAYLVVEALSQVANGVLLLTATPEQLGLESHFARLRLLDPARYADFDAFRRESGTHQQTAELVTRLASGEPLEAADKQLLAPLVGPARVAALGEGKGARAALVQDLLDQHGPGRVVFRNRRSAMAGFPRRIVHLAAIDPDSGKNIPASGGDGENSPIPNTTSDLVPEPELNWLIALMQQVRPAKVLLICRSKEKVLALEEALRLRVKFKSAVFHEDLTLIQRDRNAAYFSEAKGARLLLCSEIGSEGRNFQFAHHLVLLDLPLHPDLLEQRIGRLDRIGQTEDIHIHVPYRIGSRKEALARWYHEGLNAFAEHLEGGDHMAAQFGERLRALLAGIDLPEAQAELSALVADTRAAHAALKAQLAAGRDRLLEMNSFRPAVAERVIAQIQAEDQDTALENYLLSVFALFGLEVEDLAPRTYLLHPQDGNETVLPGLPEEGMSVSFDRKRALGREDIGFLTWEHPMVTGAIDWVRGTGMGSASYAVWRGSGSAALLLEALFVLETAGAQSRGIDRFLPDTPLRVVVDHSGVDRTELYPAAEMDPHLRPGQIDDLLEDEVFVETLLPKMLSAAKAVAEEMAAQEIMRGLRRMQTALDDELARLHALQQKNNHVRPEEIALAVAERGRLGGVIEGARVRLDGVLVVRKG